MLILDKKTAAYLKIILNEKATVKLLSTRLNKSSKTVVKDLDIIESLLEQNNIHLHKIPSKGIWISCSELDRFRLLNHIMQHDSKLLYISAESLTILSYIAFSKPSISFLSTKLFHSPSYISKNISKQNDLLISYNLNISSVNGTYLINGDEFDVRRSLSLILRDEILFDDYTNFYLNLKCDAPDFLRVFFKDSYNSLLNHLIELKLNKQLLITDITIIDLYFEVILMVNRIKNDKHLTSLIDYENYNSTHYDQTLFNVCLDFINLELNQKINEYEIYYLKYLIANRTVTCKYELVNDDACLLNLISQHLAEYKINDIENLSKRLFTHLKPAINRVANDLLFGNADDIEKFKLEDSSNDIAYLLCEKISKYYDIIKFSEAEIIQIALHIRVYLQTKSNFRVCIVSSSSQAISLLIAEKIRNNFNQIESIDILSVFEYYNHDLSNYDYIISTHLLEDRQIPIINCSTVISQTELLELSKYFIKG